MDVAVESRIERSQFRPHQDERRGDLSRFDETMEVIHHSGGKKSSQITKQLI